MELRPFACCRTGGWPRALSDNTIRLWDVATGAETARLEGHTDSVSSPLPAAGRAAGLRLGDNTIRLWDVATGAETARLEGHTSGVQALCLLPDGRLASGSRDNTIRLWDVVTGCTEIARLEIDAPVKALVAIAPNRLVARRSARAACIGWKSWTETQRSGFGARIQSTVSCANRKSAV